MAIVPNDGVPLARDGPATNRGALPPRFLVKARDAVTCIHELGHAAGLLHVNGGGRPGPTGAYR